MPSEPSEQELKEKSDPAKMEEAEGEILKEHEKEYYLYKLVGIIVHNGYAEGGHYYSYINTTRASVNDQEKSDHWLEFNDSFVKEFDARKIPDECYGGGDDFAQTIFDDNMVDTSRCNNGKLKSAYMLIYERKQKGFIPEKIANFKPTEEDIILSSLECESTAISRVEENIKPQKRIFYREAETFYTLSNFQNISLRVSEELKKVKYCS